MKAKDTKSCSLKPSTELHTMCLECAKTLSKKSKSSFGVWNDTCDFCGKKDVPCASAGHDFGVYNTEEEQHRDEVQDLL